MPFPKNAKKLTELFPDKKQQIQDYVKKYKINFNDENSFKHLIDLF